MKGYITPKLDISVLDLQDILTESSGGVIERTLTSVSSGKGGEWSLAQHYNQ
ncbi:MAG: hypothetical protein IKC59_03345 [Clostridia bacterium]|nr:hypothetical protein [Clostridia bacterium]